MRIAVVVTTVGGGGAERTAVSGADILSRGGHQVEVFSFFLEPSSKPLMKQDDFHRVFDRPRRGGILGAWDFIVGTMRIRESLKATQFDLVVSHLPYANITCILAGVRNHYSVLHTILVRKSILSLVKMFLLRAVYGNTKMIAVSEGIRESYQEVLGLPANSIRVIRNVFDFDWIRRRSLEPCSVENGRYIICVGRFVRLKRYDILIRAYGRLNTDAKLVLLGDGDERASLEHLVEKLELSNKVVFAGWQPNPYPWIRQASLLVLSSEQEGLPSVLLESLICGTPIVSTNCKAGPKEIMAGNLSSYLCRVNDVDGLASTIERAMHEYPPLSEYDFSPYEAESFLREYSKLVPERQQKTDSQAGYVPKKGTAE